jgi:hypothetical protein
MKVTTVGRGMLGNKFLEARWMPGGGGCGALIVIGMILFFIPRGCS